jgi:hypothetical protein
VGGKDGAFVPCGVVGRTIRGMSSTSAFLFPVIYDTMQSCCKLQESISTLEANECDSLSLHSLLLQ